VRIAEAPKHHARLAVSFVDYAQEIVGGLHGWGCAKVAGVFEPKPVAVAHSSTSGLPVEVFEAVGLGVAACLAVAVRMIRRPEHGGSHAR
jgi:hypothetical protein